MSPLFLPPAPEAEILLGLLDGLMGAYYSSLSCSRRRPPNWAKVFSQTFPQEMNVNYPALDVTIIGQLKELQVGVHLHNFRDLAMQLIVVAWGLGVDTAVLKQCYTAARRLGGLR